MVILLSLLGCTASPELLSEDDLSSVLGIAAEVDPDRLSAAVSRMSAANLADEGTWSEDFEWFHKARLAEAELSTAFDELGMSVEVDQADESGVETRNLVVELPGDERPDEIIILSAHYDAWFAGADDNGSGIAVLLEAARILSARPMARTLRIVAFDAEEIGGIGSSRYFLARQDEDIRGVWNMDGVGFASDEPGSQLAPTGFALPDVGNFVALMANEPATQQALVTAQIAGALPAPLSVQGAIGTGNLRTPGTSSFHRSDHSAAWSLGFPGTFLTDTANFRNPNYHTETDLPETLDINFLTRVAGTVLGAGYAGAELIP